MPKKKDEAAIILSAVEEDILTVIQGHSQGLYGLDIMNRINKASKEANRSEVGIGSLYPAFKRLEQQDLVTARWGEEAAGQEPGGARRRYYAISSGGEKALIATQQQSQQSRSSLVFAV